MPTGASACGYILMLALQRSYEKCDISGTGGDAHSLLFGNAITCSDNQNNGRQRLTDTLSQLSVETFFSTVLFSSFRQQFAGEVVTLQVCFKNWRGTILAPGFKKSKGNKKENCAVSGKPLPIKNKEKGLLKY